MIGGDEEGQLLWCGEQDVRWIAALALALAGGRIAGPRLDANIQTHFLNWGHQVAGNINSQCLQR